MSSPASNPLTADERHRLATAPLPAITRFGSTRRAHFQGTIPSRHWMLLHAEEDSASDNHDEVKDKRPVQSFWNTRRDRKGGAK